MVDASLQDRKARLLDQLENPNLTDQEIERIKTKLEVLDQQAQKQ